MHKPTVKDYLRQPGIQDALFVFACSAALLLYALYNQYTGVPVAWKLSPYLFPVLLSVFGLLLSVSLLLDGLRAMKTSPERARPAANRTGVMRTLAFLGILAACCAVMPLVGFLPASALLLVSLFLLLSARSWPVILLLSVGASGLVYLIFGVLLNVRFP